MPPAYPGALRPLHVIAEMTGRDVRLLKRWRSDGRIEPRACWVATRSLLYDAFEVGQLSLATKRRDSSACRSSTSRLG